MNTDSLVLRFRPQLRADISLPPSKSISARALIVQALAGVSERVENLSDCDDTLAMLRALGEGRREEVVDIGASGTAMRFLTAFFATREGEEHVLTGTPRMLQRPIGPLVDAFRSLGADIDYAGETGFPPLRIRGRRLQGGRVSIAAHVSSQYISALMMVGPILPRGLEIELEGTVASLPYIIMTQRLMEQWGARVERRGASLCVKPGGYQPVATYRIEPDWSAASYWFSLVALSSDANARVWLRGLSLRSIQGDSVCAELFRTLGVDMQETAEGIVLTKNAEPETALRQAWSESVQTFSMGDCPDLAQGLVVAAALCGVPFRMTGLESLKIKETDRIAALISEMRKLGCIVRQEDEGTLSFSPSDYRPSASPPRIDTFDDHRMAMAFAPAAWQFPGLTIMQPQVVTKSYPRFWHDLSCLLQED